MKPAFVTFDPKTKEGLAMASQASIGLTETYQAVARTTYKSFENNISVRDEFSRGDYEYFRPKEAIPRDKRNIIIFCMEAYRKVGLVRNIIDLMGDFTVQGIRIVHSNKNRQKFLRKWAKMVKFRETSERFANMLFRAGNVVVRRTTAKLSTPEEDKMTSQGERLEPEVVFPEQLTTSKRNIPIRYTFLNPASLEIVGGELAQFTGKQIVALKITSSLRRQITAPKPEETPLIEMLPSFIINAIKQGKDVIPLEQEKLIISHYKKDDWQGWADPMTYAILDDLILLEKMKLADLAALDGAISQIRLWKLGDLEKGIIPTEAAIEKLSDILLSNPGGGAFDLIWGPDISVTEYKTDVHHFLGGDKYEPVLRSIYAGLGVPPTLTGSSESSGTTNNFISIQTMVQRLEYVRGKLREFWEQELNLLQQSLGFMEPARIQFDLMTLSDENAQKKLMLDMWDRNLISDEAIVEMFKEFPDIEIIRQRREERERKRKLRLDKAGPYFSSDKLHEYIKIALGRGYVDPRDVGIEIQHEPTPFDTQLKSIQKGKVSDSNNKKGVSGQGRPKNSKDSTKRKSREFKVRTSAEHIDTFADFMTKNIWAKESNRAIAEIVHPIMLKFLSKSNLRELSTEEANNLERLKFTVLANLEPFSAINEEQVVNLIKSRCTLPQQFKVIYDKLTGRAYDIHGREPTIEEKKVIQSSVYALLK
jgi:hypothetical protein